jgi:hypothetical protein
MVLEETLRVRPEDERPNRRDGTCFYCSRAMGEPHENECVIASKAVVLRVTLEVVVDVPLHWTKENIEFHRNDGSWCSDNFIDRLAAWADKEDDERAGPGCACASSSFEYLRDATAEDFHTAPVLIDLGKAGNG